ncbi:hypothetical protein [Bacillus sp. XF8]|uniref:hypothetical protein n=1 Tax=Bacillus sp. XF8 TaxID=2819289 RepID=UPI0027DC4249|nr:hypothetical protein [Bacillus sp. XF8]
MYNSLLEEIKHRNCIHKYNFIKTQDSENFKTGQMGIASFYKCEKCGKEKVEYKYNNDINSDLWNI